MTEASTERPTLRVSFTVAGLVMLALAALAVVAGHRLWQSYGSAMPKSLFHVPNDSTYAARIELPNAELEAAVRPLLDVIDASRGGLPSRCARLAQRGGVDLKRAVREIAIGQGPEAGDWVVTASGDLPSTGLIEAIAAVLKEEGWAWRHEPEQARLVAPEGIALGQATDGTLILASDLTRLARAQKRDTGEPARAVARGVFPEPEQVGRSALELSNALRTRTGVR